MLTLNVTKLESRQYGNPTWHLDETVVDEQSTFRSPSGNDKQLDCVPLDKRSRRYCTDAKANDMVHLVSDHRSVTAHDRFPCFEKKGGLNKEDGKTDMYKMQETIWINGDDPEPYEKSMKSSEHMMNLQRGSLASMKQQQTRKQ